MVGRSRVALVLAVILVCAGALAACGGGDDDDGGNGNNGNGNSETNGDGGAANEAQQVFIDVGCAECHGENGEGDGSDPRTNLRETQIVIIEQQFLTRVRNGRGEAMPAYTEEEISNEQIQMIYEWLYGS